jgi:threonine dehydrogenase-like Zn-dependent dehydrogenase
VPDNVTDEDAVLVEPTAVGWHALQAAGLWPGDTIAVIGLGAIGLLLTHLALALGYKVVAHDQIQEKTALAERWGATAVHVEEGEKINSQLKAQFAVAEASAVFECAGTAKAATLAIEAAPPGSAVVMVGMAHEPVPFTPFDINRRGLSILTSMIYNHPADFSRTIDLIAKGTIQPAQVISHRCQFAQFPEALNRAASGAETKVVLDIA